MQATIQYVSDLLAGAILIVAAMFHVGLMAWLAFVIGAALIAFAVVGSNVASYIAMRQGITIGEPEQIDAPQQ
jgi:hypothetical protein